MGLQDEMTFQRIEVLLDMHTKKVQSELQKLREELSQVKEELRKEIQTAVRQDAPVQQYAPPQPQWQQAPPQAPPQQFQGQFGAAPAPQWAQAGQGTQFQGNQQAAAPAQAPPLSKPIDRNGVAPADVSIEKFFYMGNRK